MKNVRNVTVWTVVPGAALGVVLGVAGAGCAKKSAPPAAAEPADPEFDKKWAALAHSGLEALYIEDDRGEGLMGNVRRVTKPSPPALAPPPAEGALPPQPSGEDVHRVIRTHLSSVKTCYMTMSRAGFARSGKAIVSFTVGADGKPADVKVDAPTFTGTPLPSCVTNQVARWSFPKSQKGGGAVSYPFVFVGG
jgi:hypothetical protein